MPTAVCCVLLVSTAEAFSSFFTVVVSLTGLFTVGSILFFTLSVTFFKIWLLAKNVTTQRPVKKHIFFITNNFRDCKKDDLSDKKSYVRDKCTAIEQKLEAGITCLCNRISE